MKDDYNLEELQKILVRGLAYNVMPRYLYHYTDKDYEKFSLDLLERIVEPGGTAIDIGAHYGIYSLLAAKNSKKVYAFEPVPENFEVLKKNIHQNKLETIISPINKAVSDEEGSVEFNVTWASDSAGFYEHPNAEVIRKIEVLTNSIDNELSDIKDLSFIKIDTEGHEIHVLQGLRQTLHRNKKAKMLIEYNPQCLNNAGSDSHQLIEKIISLDYDIFAVYEDSRYMLQIDINTSEEDILQGQTYLNLLCLPHGSWESLLFLSHNAGIGGAELVLLRTIQSLIKQTDTFVVPFVILPGDGPLTEKFKQLPVAIKVVPMRGWTDNAKLDQTAARTVKILNSVAIGDIAKVMNDFKPGVVITNTMSIPWAAYVARALDIPHIWSIHEFGELDHGLVFDYSYPTSMCTIDSLSQSIIVNSQAVADYIASYVTPKKLVIMNPNVPLPVLSGKHIKNIYSKDCQLKLAISGHISPTKGQLEAIQAVHALRLAGHKAELIVIGTKGPNSYYDRIKAYCAANKLQDFIYIVGFQENPADYIDLADIVLMCSSNEAFGMVTVEAMLQGKVVIGTRSAGTAELIQDGVSGLLYTPHDVSDLTEKISNLMNETVRRRLAVRGQQYARKHFPNSYDADFYKLVLSVKSDHLSKHRQSQIFKDILEGSWRGRLQLLDQQHTADEQSRLELQHFNQKYNEVYAAYNDVSARLTALHGSKVVRLRKRLGSIKRTIKNQRKSGQND